MEWRIRGIGALAVLVVLVGIVLDRRVTFSPVNPRPGISSPILALELAQSAKEVEDTVGPLGHDNRKAARTNTNVDFAFIFCYWSLFLALSWLLSHRSFSWAGGAAVAPAFLATLGAAFDVLENLRIIRVLGTSLDATTAEMLQDLHRATALKWAFLFAALGFLSPLFLWRNDPVAVLGVLILATAGIGLGALAIYLPGIEWGGKLMGLSLIAVAGLFLSLPGAILRRF